MYPFLFLFCLGGSQHFPVFRIFSFPFLSSVFLPYILYNNVSILPSSRSPVGFLVFITNSLSVYLQNIFIIPGKNLCEYLVFVGVRCTFAPAFGKGASLFERSVSVSRFPRLFFSEKKLREKFGGY